MVSKAIFDHSKWCQISERASMLPLLLTILVKNASEQVQKKVSKFARHFGPFF
jgi:hypothetical protein